MSKVIDSHCHIFVMNGYEFFKDRPLMEYIDHFGMEKNAVIACNERENDEVIEAVQKYPDKLFGIAYVNVHDMDNSLAKLREYVKRGIFRGVKMHPYCNDFQVDDPAIFPVYETCIELDIPVLYHTGWLNFSDIDANNKSDNVYKYSCIGFPVQFGTVMEKFPELKLICAHFGGNFYQEFLGMAERFPNLYLDTAWLAHYAERMMPPVSVQEWIEHAVKIVGSKQIIFGGEGTYPIDIERCRLTQEEKEDILYNNAKRLYKC